MTVSPASTAPSPSAWRPFLEGVGIALALALVAMVVWMVSTPFLGLSLFNGLLVPAVAFVSLVLCVAILGPLVLWIAGWIVILVTRNQTAR